MTSPLPVVSARKISPFGATVSQRGLRNPFVYTFTLNPGGTAGRNPSGGFSLFGPLPADLVSKGAGSFGFSPWVTCAGKHAAIARLAAKQKTIFNRIYEASLNFKLSCFGRMHYFAPRFHWTQFAQNGC